MTPSAQTALVTGASTGIGRAIALRLSEHGYHVGLVGRNASTLEQTMAEITSLGGSSEVAIADLTQEGSIREMAASLLLRWPTIDVLVNCAGVWHDADRAFYGLPLWEITGEELNEVLDVGLRAPMLLAQQIMPRMVQQRKGKVVNISGTFSSGGAGWLHYFVSKKALEDFTIGLADEVRPFGVSVNCVSPADVRTPALKRFFPDDYEGGLEPTDVAEFVLFLVSNASEHITGSCTVLRKSPQAD